MGFALWIDPKGEVAWAQGTHEYRPMGVAVVARSDQFRQRDFLQDRKKPPGLENSFAGFFGSLETVNEYLRRESKTRLALRPTPGHLR